MISSGSMKMKIDVDYHEYFIRLLAFLEEYRWLIDFAVTDILVCDVFSKIPSDWLHIFKKMTYEDTILLSHEHLKPDWPESLSNFFDQCHSFEIESLLNLLEDDWPKCDLDKELLRGLSPKKLCEVESLSGLVDFMCQQADCKGVVDIGAGLGYLDRFLASKGYNVLGIEGNDALVQKANNQIEKMSPPISERVTFHPLRLDEESTVEFLNTVETFSRKNYLKNGLCMVGLHTCGDLASSALRMFLNIPLISVAVIMPCCYHKMSMVDNPRYESTQYSDQVVCSKFKNFPLSKTLSMVFCKPAYKEIFYRPFLRLASQENYYRWRGWTVCDHENNAFNVMSRAVLQFYAHKEGLQLKKFYRRALNKNVCSNFSSFIDGIWDCFDFIDVSSQEIVSCNSDVQRKISKGLMTLWNEHENLMVLTEIVLILQMSMQSLIETFILMDFLSFLQENHIDNLKVAKLCDSKISPRNFALIASKIKL